MAYCNKCGKEVHQDAEVCVHCGCRIKNKPLVSAEDGGKVIRAALTFFLGFIGSIIINHTSLKPEGWRSRSCAYFFLTIVTFGIYGLVASLCNLTFDPRKSSNVGYFRD